MRVRSGWWTQRFARLSQGIPTSPTLEAPAWRELGTAPTERADLDGSTVDHTPPDGAAAPHEAARLARASGPPLRRVEQFVLLERIGAGGMGEVYAAFDDKLERKVAIKLVATHGGDDRARQRLLREAQALARLSHPNVVTVYEVGTLPDGGLFIAMELVKGKTLWAWQRERPRTWRELVAMYSEAGHGLAAAHSSGIVHRDFKPDNVLVGDDGRVRVVDFGLALAGEAPPDQAPGTIPDATPRPRSALTIAGRVAGTPGYMAPEQLAGAAIDARADQFSFCVALYEALHGERPEAGGEGGVVGATRAARRGEAEPSYPRWLGDAVTRGLAHDPAERFATMAALLVELTRHRERTRRRLVAAGLVGALATGVVAAAALRGAGDPPCPLATGELTGVWDAATRQRSEVAVLGTGAPFAAVAWASTATAFDRYAQRWLGAQQAACEATHVRHVQSPALLDLRIECLAGRRRSLAAAADVLQGQPAQAVAHAGELLASLGDIERCADSGALLEPGAAAPASPAAQQRAAAIRQQLAGASARLAAWDAAGAEPVVAAAARLETGLGDDGVRAELRYIQARVKLARGEVREAIAVFDQALSLAVASHHDELPADIWVTLALDVGTVEQRPADIEQWLALGEAWLRRLGHPSDSRRVGVEHARGTLALIGGKPRDAVIALSRATTTAETLWGKDDPRLIPLLRDRALAQARAGQPRPAADDDERALAIGLAAWGPDYPDIASTRSALGLLYIEQLGDVARGEREVTLALRLFSAQLGADSNEVAACEQALSVAGQYRGDYAAALTHAERAEQIYARRSGVDHARHGESLMGVGVLRFMRKDFAGSLAAYEAAYPILAAALGASHTTVGVLHSNTGETLLALGRPDAALAEFQHAIDILTDRLGPDHPDLALPLKGAGLVRLRRGQPLDAVAPLERALALSTRAAGDPQELAEIRWALARALRALGRDPARSRELATAALAAYRGLGSESADRVTDITRWLAGAR